MEVRFPDVKDSHVLELAAFMRVDDIVECHDAGYRSALEAVRHSVEASVECRACTIDGEVMAIYGVIPNDVLNGHGTLWLLTTETVDEHRKTFVRYASLVLLLLKTRWRRLSLGIGSRHVGALKLALHSGFKPGETYFDRDTGQPFTLHTIGG